MIKTFLTDFPICIFIGLLFSLYRNNIERDDPFYRFASFWWGLIAMAIYSALVINSYSQWPEWMWMYYIEPIKIELAGWVYILFLAYFIPYVVGYILGTHGRRNSWFVLFNSFVVILFIEVYALHSFWDRYSYLMTEGQKVSIFEVQAWVQNISIGIGSLFLFCLISGLVARRRYIRALESGKIVKHLFHPGKRRTLQTLAEAMLPEAPDLRRVSGKDMNIGYEFSVELADMNFLNRQMMRIFVEYMNSAPFIYKGYPIRFEFLSKEKQVEILDKMQYSKNITKKIPLTVLRMFILQIYYQDQRVLDELGYIGESWGMFRPHLRWMNVPEYRERERSVVWSELSKTMKKTSK